MPKILVYLHDDVLQYTSKYIDLNEFCTTCKSLWNGELRKDIVYFFLRGPDALRFYKEEDFRTYVYSRVTKPNKQISVDLLNCDQVQDTSALGNVHRLCLSWCRNLRDVSALGNVYNLDLHNCSGVRDVSALGNVHRLNLSDCSNLIDVSGLEKVHDLNLSGCSNVTNVSALGDVDTLNLSYYLDLGDCFNLGNVIVLT